MNFAWKRYPICFFVVVVFFLILEIKQPTLYFLFQDDHSTNEKQENKTKQNKK